MIPQHVKHGQRVRTHDGREAIVLDRAPRGDHWWLQDPETGVPFRDQYSAHGLQLVRDDYRDTDTLTTASGAIVPVKFRAGVWAVVNGGKHHGWQVFHAPDGKYLSTTGLQVDGKRRGPLKMAEARRLAVELSVVLPSVTDVTPEDLKAGVLSALSRTFGREVIAA